MVTIHVRASRILAWLPLAILPLAAASIGGCPGGIPIGPPCSGAPKTFQGRELVTLDGGASFDPQRGELHFDWAQLTGTPVQLTNTQGVTTGFIAPNVSETLTFRLKVTDNLGFTDICVASVIIQKACDLAVDAGPDRQINLRETTTLAGSATCGLEPIAYLWEQVSGPSQTLTDAGRATATVTATAPGTAVFRLTVSDAAGSTATDEASVVVACNVPTTITRQPANQTICASETAVFSLDATGGTPLAFQWRRGTTNVVDDSRITGATTATLTILQASANDAGTDYNCVVTGLCGSTTSANAALSLKTPTAITRQPTSQLVVQGGTALFSIGAEGAGTLRYQWQRNGQNLTESTRFAGVTTATLTVTSVGTDVLGNYRCIVTADCGTLTSNDVTLAFDGASRGVPPTTTGT